MNRLSRLLLVGVTGMVTALFAAPAAFADVGPFDLEQYIGPDGAYEDITDVGHGNILILSSAGESDWTETSCVVVSGHSWCLLKDDSGLCANLGSDDYVYADSCVSGDTSEEWWKTGYIFENRHTGLDMSEIQNPVSGIRFIDVDNSGFPWNTPSS